MLRKRCSRTTPPTLPDGTANPLCCPASPRCGHPWHYDFRVHRRRYRASTETADKQVARDIEARERARVLDARHGIKRQPDLTFREFSATYLRDHADLNKKSAGGTTRLSGGYCQFSAGRSFTKSRLTESSSGSASAWQAAGALTGRPARATR